MQPSIVFLSFSNIYIYIQMKPQHLFGTTMSNLSHSDFHVFHLRNLIGKKPMNATTRSGFRFDNILK